MEKSSRCNLGMQWRMQLFQAWYKPFVYIDHSSNVHNLNRMTIKARINASATRASHFQEFYYSFVFFLTIWRKSYCMKNYSISRKFHVRGKWTYFTFSSNRRKIFIYFIYQDIFLCILYVHELKFERQYKSKFFHYT